MITPGKQVRIISLKFNEAQHTVDWHLVSVDNAQEQEIITTPLRGIFKGAKKAWFVKAFIDKVFTKEFQFEDIQTTQHDPKTYHRVFIGPYRALQLLSKNLPDQRAIVPCRVDNWCREIVDGSWQEAMSQTISVNTLGQTQDGQHRLAGIVLAATKGKTTRSSITVGLPPASVAAIDIGDPRPLMDNLVMSNQLSDDDSHVGGLPHGRITASVRAIAIEATLDENYTKGRPQKIAEIIKLYRDSYLVVGPFTKGFTNSHLLRRGDVVAAFVLAHRSAPDETAEFLRQVASNIVISNNPDHPVQRVIGFLVKLSGKGKKGVYTASEEAAAYSKSSKVVYKILYGVQSYMANKTTNQLPVSENSLFRFYQERSNILDAAGTQKQQALPQVIQPGVVITGDAEVGTGGGGSTVVVQQGFWPQFKKVLGNGAPKPI